MSFHLEDEIVFGVETDYACIVSKDADTDVLFPCVFSDFSGRTLDVVLEQGRDFFDRSPFFIGNVCIEYFMLAVL